MKEWTGNSKSIFVCHGASNHSLEERQIDDYYATDPIALEELLQRESFKKNIWECACGEGHLSKVLLKKGYDVLSTDIVDRGFESTCILDFFNAKTNTRDIITNPPYKFAKEFVRHALDISTDGVKVAMFLKLTFLESKARKELFEKYPPKYLYVFSYRVQCAKNGDFDKYGKGVGTAVAYAWFVWEKGYQGEPRIKWI